MRRDLPTLSDIAKGVVLFGLLSPALFLMMVM
jgi:hypothetical protein